MLVKCTWHKVTRITLNSYHRQTDRHTHIHTHTHTYRDVRCHTDKILPVIIVITIGRGRLYPDR